MAHDGAGGAAVIIEYRLVPQPEATYRFAWINSRGRVRHTFQFNSTPEPTVFRATPSVILLRIDGFIRRISLRNGRVVTTDKVFEADEYPPSIQESHDPGGFFTHVILEGTGLSEIRRYKN